MRSFSFFYLISKSICNADVDKYFKQIQSLLQSRKRNYKKSNMSKNKLILNWVLYLLGLIIIIFEFGFSANEVPSYINFSIAVLILTVPWIVCIIDAAKRKDVNGIWVWGLIAQGMIVIPFYLLKQKPALDK